MTSLATRPSATYLRASRVFEGCAKSPLRTRTFNSLSACQREFSTRDFTSSSSSCLARGTSRVPIKNRRLGCLRLSTVIMKSFSRINHDRSFTRNCSIYRKPKDVHKVHDRHIVYPVRARIAARCYVTRRGGASSPMIDREMDRVYLLLGPLATVPASPKVLCYRYLSKNFLLKSFRAQFLDYVFPRHSRFFGSVLATTWLK